MTEERACKTCAYLLHHYDSFCDLKKLRVNQDICSCAYWTKERINWKKRG